MWFHRAMALAKKLFKRYDLRFPSQEDEAGFKATIEPEVLNFGLVGVVLALGTWFVHIVPSIVRELGRKESMFQFSFHDARTFC